MKSIPLALAGLLGLCPAWAADTVEQPEKPPQKRTAPVASPASIRQETPSEELPAVAPAGEAMVQPANSASPQIVNHVAANAPEPSSPNKKTPNEKTSDEVTGKSDEKTTKKTTNGIKPPAAAEKETIFKEMVVTGEVERDTHYTSPSTRVTRQQIERQNAQTTEEVLKYQPSLQIRQRYVGDPNGVLGIRGADMFSTARNMVYADGLPLHNFLQATFNGAPRWSLVGPNEIDAVDVVYGPFSAEYSGNSIGGVINIKTRMPKKQEFYVESSVFIQPFKIYGPDSGTFVGDRQYVAYGNRFQDRFTVYLAYNRLEAQSHPMSYFIDNSGLARCCGRHTD